MRSPDEVAQDPPLARGGKREPGRLGLVEELVEGVLESALGKQVGLDRVQDPEPGVDARGDRVGGEQAPAEAVDGRQPGAGGARQLPEPPRPCLVAELLGTRGPPP